MQLRSISATEILDTISSPVFEKVETIVPLTFTKTTIDSLSIRNQIDLSEVLQNNSSLFIKSYGSGSLATPSFRGTGSSHTNILWNGITLNAPTNGQVDLSLYPTFFFDEVELHHGASGLLSGNGALGGSVSINSIQDYSHHKSSLVNYQLGSYGFHNIAAQTNIGYNNWNLSTKLYYKESENNFPFTNTTINGNPTELMANAQLKQYGIEQSVFRKLPNGEIGGRVWYFNSHRHLPGNILSENHSEIQDDASLRAIISYQKTLSRFYYKASIGFINDQLIYQNPSTQIYSSNVFQNYENKLNTILYINNKAKFKNDISMKYEMASSDGYSEKKQRFFTNWLTGIHYRLSRFQIDIFNRFMHVSTKTLPLSPGIGFRYQPLEKKKIYVMFNSGINYRFPTLNDLFWNPGGNPDLKTEQARMIDLGLEHTKSVKQWNILNKLTLFYSHVNNWIIWLPTELGYWSPNNLKEVENSGLEYHLSASKIWKNFTTNLKVNYTYTRSINNKASTINDLSVNKQLIYVPYHKANVSLTFTRKVYELRYNYNYIGKRYITSDNNWFLPNYFVHNVSLSGKKRITKQLIGLATLKCNNLLNQEYQSIAHRPTMSRNYMVSLSLLFK